MTVIVAPPKPKASLKLHAALALVMATAMGCLVLTWSKVGEARVISRIGREHRSGDVLSRQFDNATRDSLHQINQELQIGAVHSGYATARWVGILLALPLSWKLVGWGFRGWMLLVTLRRRVTALRIERPRSQHHKREAVDRHGDSVASRPQYSLQNVAKRTIKRAVDATAPGDQRPKY
jgi:hypothetical protein